MIPPDMPVVCFGLRSRMAARAVTRACNAALRPLDLQITQFSLLAAISLVSDDSIATRAERLDIEPSTLLRNLDVLEARGLVAADGGRGRRGRRYALTAEGEALLMRALPVWRQVQDRFAAMLGEQAQDVRAGLRRLENAALQLEKELA